MKEVIVLTKWDHSIPGYNRCDVAERYPGEWTDITEQPDENIPLDINVVVWHGKVEDSVLTQLEADNSIVVMVAGERDANGQIIGPKPETANPTAGQRTAMVNWMIANNVPGPDRAALVRTGVSRKTIADDIRAWAKARPRKT